jgi:serine/threonine protein kinase
MAEETLILPARYGDATRVARGGMGDVYRATDSVLGRPVAVKLLSERFAANEDIRKRFTREALAAARLSADPNVVTIYDVGESSGRPFIVMQYLAGGSLDDVLKRGGAQPPERALGWLVSAGSALDHAHRNGVVHRDVKPANILLDDEGSVYVADFGIASAAGLDSLTQTGTILGTAGYLSPEQAEGRTAGPAADRYALGVVAFELLTGSRPFETESTAAEAAAHVGAPVPSVSSRGHGIPHEADAVFRRALAKAPSDRFSSCAEFVAALHDAYSTAAGPTRIAALPEQRSVDSSRHSWRLPLAAALLALLLLAGGAVGALIVGGGGREANAPTRVTVTEPGPTVRETVTEQTTTAQTPTANPPASSPSGAQLAQRGFQKLQAGDTAGALALLEQAARKLQGTNSLGEAYNDYNLAYALARIQGCSTQLLQLLDASQAIQGHRKQIDQLRKSCKRGAGGSNGDGQD